MNCMETHLNYEEQLEKFISRGMIIKDKKKALERIKHISYYKIKEFSTFFMNSDGTYKKDTYFEAVIQNFYFDKNLRMEFLKCSEKIELSIKNKIAYILGAKYGAFGYLKFSNWCDRKIPKDNILKEEGRVIFKTDNRPLFDFSLEEVEEAGWTLEKCTFDLHHSEYLEGNIMTEYEEKFVAKGNPICMLQVFYKENK